MAPKQKYVAEKPCKTHLDRKQNWLIQVMLGEKLVAQVYHKKRKTSKLIANIIVTALNSAIFPAVKILKDATPPDLILTKHRTLQYYDPMDFLIITNKKQALADVEGFIKILFRPHDAGCGYPENVIILTAEKLHRYLTDIFIDKYNIDALLKLLSPKYEKRPNLFEFNRADFFNR